jgi:hypothetical protein
VIIIIFLCQGLCFLGDYGAAVSFDADLVEISIKYHPTDMDPVESGKRGIDHLLLIVTAIEMLGIIKIEQGFTIAEMKTCVNSINNQALKDRLTSSWELAVQDGILHN